MRDLRGNWVRSALTTLGIFMGVAAVNATLNIDAITNRVLQDQLAARDNPNLSVSVYGRSRPRVEFDAAQIAELERAVPGILSTSRVSYVWAASEVRHLDQVTDNFDAWSVSENYQRTTGRRVLSGRFFDAEDFEAFRAVVILDTVLAQRLFQGADAVGEGVFINGTRFTVVGLIEAKNLESSEDGEPPGTLWMTEPYSTILMGRRRRSQLQVALRDIEDYATLPDQLEAQLQQMFPGYDIYMEGNVEDLYEEEKRQRASIRVLKAVGLLALVIGGVGIANITIAAIMERTREIGLRRAIGATDLEIMAQFIAEAALLSLIGGTAAVGTVHLLTKTATTTLFEAPYSFSWRDATLSMGAAFGVGVGASLLPALRVTRIDVVQALRGE
jgi:putative ABC transport system permease protein